jgi:hypothetical protein
MYPDNGSHRCCKELWVEDENTPIHRFRVVHASVKILMKMDRGWKNNIPLG